MTQLRYSSSVKPRTAWFLGSGIRRRGLREHGDTGSKAGPVGGAEIEPDVDRHGTATPRRVPDLC